MPYAVSKRVVPPSEERLGENIADEAEPARDVAEPKRTALRYMGWGDINKMVRVVNVPFEAVALWDPIYLVLDANLVYLASTAHVRHEDSARKQREEAYQVVQEEVIPFGLGLLRQNRPGPPFQL